MQRRYTIGQAVCVQHTLCYSVGQINLIPSTVYVYLVPSMVASSGIALRQRARDALAAAHSCKQGRQVIADALAAAQRSACVRDIFAYLAGCDFICKLCIVGVMPCNVVVDCGYLFCIGCCALADFSRLLADCITCCKLHICGGDKVGSIFVFDFCIYGFSADNLIGCTGNVFTYGNSVCAIALIQREFCSFAARAVFIGGLIVTVLDADLQFGIGSVIYGNKTIFCMGSINRTCRSAGCYHACHRH